MDDDRLLTAGEVAEIFRVDPKTVSRWARAGKLPYIKTLGGHRRFRESAVIDLMEKSKEYGTQSEPGTSSTVSNPAVLSVRTSAGGSTEDLVALLHPGLEDGTNASEERGDVNSATEAAGG